MKACEATDLPYIFCRFDSNLLSNPCPKFRDDCETLAPIFNWIMDHYHGDDISNENRRNKIILLERKFLNIYERAKAKEKELEGKKDHVTQGFCYYFAMSPGYRNWLFERLRQRSYQYSRIHLDWTNIEIQKV